MAYRSFRPSGFEARGVRKVTNICGSFKARCATVASQHCAAEFSIADAGNAPELREYPKAQSYQAIGANPVVATIATVGMVIRLWDATMGNPPPSP